MYDHSRLEPMISAEQIATRVRELGAELSALYSHGEPVICIGVLKGSVFFLADLMRAIEGDVRCDFLGVSSYEGMRSSGQVRLTHDLRESIAGKHVLIVEDIVDSGLTLHYLRQTLSVRNPKSLRIVTLLDKPSKRTVEVDVEHVGFAIPDAFVVGYGLDLDERFRHLPYIAIYHPE